MSIYVTLCLDHVIRLRQVAHTLAAVRCSCPQGDDARWDVAPPIVEDLVATSEVNESPFPFHEKKRRRN